MSVRTGSSADLSLLVDGGSRGNPGFGYGSFRLTDREGHDRIVRLEFEDLVTNNQAEYRTLIAALEAAIAHALEHGWPPERLSLSITSDSKLVVEQITGRWQVRQPQLRHLYRRARALLGRFGEVEITWRPRSEVAAVLGH